MRLWIFGFPEFPTVSAMLIFLDVADLYWIFDCQKGIAGRFEKNLVFVPIHLLVTSARGTIHWTGFLSEYESYLVALEGYRGNELRDDLVGTTWTYNSANEYVLVPSND